MIKLFLKIACFVFIICFSCGNSNEFYSVEIVDGVRIVHNIKPLWGDEPKIELEFVKQIGDFDAVDENFIMYRILDIQCDLQGNIYILDYGNRRIQKFDTQGKFIKTIGRKGNGPGEYTTPLAFDIDSQGNILVGDASGSKVILFDADGNDLQRITIDRRMETTMRYIPDNKIIIGGNIWRIFAGEFNSNLYPTFSIYDYQGYQIAKFGEPTVLETFSSSIPNSLMDGSASLDVDDEGNLYIAYLYENIIEKRNMDGELIYIIDRPLNYEVNEFHYENTTMVYPNIVATGISVDSEERIWVSTASLQPEKWDSFSPNLKISRKENTTLEIFDREGILLGKVPLPIDLFRFRIIGDRFFVIDAEQISVNEYKIVEK